MIILGIDPGTTSIGYAILECSSKPHLAVADLFTIRGVSTQERLKELYLGIQILVKRWRPDAVALERLFFAKNAKTALAVSEARGATLLTTALAGLRVYEYTPLEIKKTVTGDGRADKLQIKKMVGIILPQTAGLRARDDVFDAIAIALTYYYKDANRKPR
ncbi:MAG: crossover junction endodeoxyribonuclease RuvC [Candidatus Sungbacteria bacterium RIFCSPHIGHO2_02_FULL_47_11]|uniref:Crossover junction endodeoxyribonuclease RuvC n=1 Tax=Candidatus Sungbacteria bacterium RIFCSPHIGHO2_02_FULL_47_11 TaxID=1802270 RepID=A0A1G2KJZ2_9BACT|nr:MAG: crossover junction endodeoxyribonuclease RuvC [Candidatus Sungbacteria bacterium RIFCSPHIGHO2_02_FULL_47_11]